MSATAPQNSSSLPEVQARLQTYLTSIFSDKLFVLPSNAWEYGLTFGLRRENATEIFKTLRDDPKLLFNFLMDVTCVDWLDRREPRFDVVYQLFSLSYSTRLSVKIQVPEDQPEVDSLVSLWAGANFLEREVWDMYGIKFKGHPDLRRILMYDEFVGHPLRKDYPLRGKQPRVTMRIPELRNTSDDMYREQLVAMPKRKKALS